MFWRIPGFLRNEWRHALKMLNHQLRLVSVTFPVAML